MKFLDTILGKTKPPEAKTDQPFAISTAAVTLDTSLGYKADGAARVCIKLVESSRCETTRAKIEELLELSIKETGRVQNLEGRV